MCCETEAECAAIGFETPQPCDLGACVDRTCQDTGCDGNEDCDGAQCVDDVCVSDSAFCSQNGGLIVYDSDRDGGRDLYVTLGGGTSTPLTTGPDLKSLPTPSPQRDRIAYLRQGSSTRDIFVVASDGSGSLNASNSTEADAHAVWSPDGALLGITSEVGTAFIVRSIGGSYFPLQGLPEGTTVDPTWSPDVQIMAYASNTVADGGAIFTILIDGTSRTEIIRATNFKYGRTQWSPDGTLIGYLGTLDVGLPDLYVTNSTGTVGQNLTSTYTASETDFQWSHDGSMIAFVREQTNRSDIWVVEANGSNPRSITFDAGRNEHPKWSADDRFLTFDSNRDGQWEIYRVAQDGSGLTNVTMNAADDRNPAWLPCPSP